MPRLKLIIVGMLLSLSTTVSEPVKAADHQALVLRIIDDHVLPRLETLSEASQRNADAWKVACLAGALTDTQEVRQAFHDLSDAWIGIDHINLGPVNLFFRRDRFYHWPGRKNSVGRALAKLAQSPPNYSDAVAFGRSSVAVQGIPAIERILYTNKPPLDATGRCQLGSAIARNLVKISTSLKKEWLQLREFVVNNQASPIYFSDMTEAASLLLTDLSTGFVKLGDIRLKPMLGSSPDFARPKRGEQWRSGRTVTNLVLTLSALRDMTDVFGWTLPDTKRKLLMDEVDGLIKSAQSLPTELDPGLYDAATWRQFDDLRSDTELVAGTVISALSQHYDVRIGFNALDGDG